MSRDLGVFCDLARIGTLRVEPDDAFAFIYDAAWLSRPDRFPVSVSVPLAEGWSRTPAVRGFFTNLLPEGAVRDAIARRLHLSPDNDFGLLAAIGGECAGALSILPEGQTPDAQAHDYAPLSDAELAAMVRRYDVFAGSAARPGVRLSLAGAQDKLPVFCELDGSLWLPLKGSPSTHILKVPSRHFKHLTENEALVLALARAMGLNAVAARWMTVEGEGVVLISRYDRLQTPAGIKRLHQEDLCQALGLPASQKYEEEGGPGLSSALSVVRAHSSEPLGDAQRLLQWIIFNALVNNADGHGKNLSLLYQGSDRRLAPLYDLLCTAVYPSVDRRLAMRIGGENDPGQINKPHWIDVAGAAGIGPRAVLNLVKQMAEAMPDTFADVARAHVSAHGPAPIAGRIQRAIHKQCRRSLTLLR
jgi:serine/threonine-protein kinase HipA